MEGKIRMPIFDSLLNTIYTQSKYTESKHEQNLTMVQMQREIDILRATEESFRKKVLELELDNDDLERTERQVFVLFTPFFFTCTHELISFSNSFSH